mgnify:CR=1 FL=1
MKEIRHSYYCKNKMKDTDVVIMAHTHEDIDDEETNNYTIGPFSMDLLRSSYGLISFSDCFKFEHKTDFQLKHS